MDLHSRKLTRIFQFPKLTILQEGLLTIIIAVVAYWFISNYPDTVIWLNKEERAFIQARLKADSDATNEEAFSWAEVAIAAKDIKIWLYALAFHTMSLPLYTLSLFLVRIPHILFAPTTLTSKAHHNPRHGLHSCAIATPNHPSLRRSNNLHSLLGHTLRTLLPTRPSYSQPPSSLSSATSSYSQTRTPKRDRAYPMSALSSRQSASTLPSRSYSAGPLLMSRVKRSAPRRMLCRSVLEI
jgi:hypothetical protein